MVIDSGEQIRKLAMKEIKARKSLKRIDTLILIVAMVGILVLMIYGSLFFYIQRSKFYIDVAWIILIYVVNVCMGSNACVCVLKIHQEIWR